jgi:hypothetical protein
MSEREQENIINTDQSPARSSPTAELEITRDEVKKMLDETKAEIREETKKDIERQVQLDRASLLTVFGVFASIIGFFNFEVHFLKTVKSLWDIVGFSCIMCALLISFNIVLDYLMQSRLNKDAAKLHSRYIFFMLVLFGLGCCAIYQGEQVKKIDTAVKPSLLLS